MIATNKSFKLEAVMLSDYKQYTLHASISARKPAWRALPAIKQLGGSQGEPFALSSHSKDPPTGLHGRREQGPLLAPDPRWPG